MEISKSFDKPEFDFQGKKTKFRDANVITEVILEEKMMNADHKEDEDIFKCSHINTVKTKEKKVRKKKFKPPNLIQAN